jgi:hypothetical protein
MNDSAIIVVVGLLCLLVVAVILRYRSKGEAEFSIRDWLTFKFRGSNAPSDDEASERQTDPVADRPSVAVEEYVGRDKITVYNSPNDSPAISHPPELVLQLISEGGEYVDEISRAQTQKEGVVQDFYFRFGLALLNRASESVPAKEIDIRVDIYWQGAELQSAPEFMVDIHDRTTSGWQVQRSHIRQLRERPSPAVLIFKGSDMDRCAFGHPLQWQRFRGHLYRRTTGYFALHYRISSLSPRTDSEGELRIVLR